MSRSKRSAFGGKKAAPFSASKTGRKQSSKRTHKGTLRKRGKRS